LIHKIDLISQNLHSSFSKDYLPILTIDSGDSLQFKTPDIKWGYSPAKGEDSIALESRENEKIQIHPMIGPIAIRGAKPGMVLEVKLNDIVPCWYGHNWAGGD
jgi:acetamidase/formamidase